MKCPNCEEEMYMKTEAVGRYREETAESGEVRTVLVGVGLDLSWLCACGWVETERKPDVVLESPPEIH